MENVFNILKLIWDFVINSQWIASIFGGFVAFILTYFFYPYIKKRAETLAEQRAAKKKAYNEEKGKNAATKEDIEEITRKIEEVKTEISFANQRKHERIVEQEKCLIDIAYYSNLICNMSSRLTVNLTYQSDRSKIDKFLEDLDSYESNLIYNRNRALISIDDVELNDAIDGLIKHMRDFTPELKSIAANAGQTIDSYVISNQILDKFMDKIAFTDEEKCTMIADTMDALKETNNLPDVMKKTIPYEKEFHNSYDQYLKILKDHFGLKLEKSFVSKG